MAPRAPLAIIPNPVITAGRAQPDLRRLSPHGIIGAGRTPFVIEVRPAEPADIPAIAAIRAEEWETDAYWTARIGGYLREERSPQQALATRAVFVAVDGSEVVGFVAGHRTRRFGCAAELQWINVAHARRGQGIAGTLMVKIAAWFAHQEAGRICVNVEPDNAAARKLYQRFGAQRLNDYWLIWDNAQAMREGGRL